MFIQHSLGAICTLAQIHFTPSSERGREKPLRAILFTANFILLLRREIFLDFKSVSNSLGGGALFDTICNSLARQVQQILDVQKIRCENYVEQDFILHTNELAVKCVFFIVRSHGNIKFVMLLQIVEHLLQDVGLAAGKKVNSEKKGEGDLR